MGPCKGAVDKVCAMNLTVYGQLDPDESLLKAIFAWAEARGGVQTLTVVAHQRVPMGSRICKWPGSLTYDFLLDDSRRAYAARQLPNGAIKCPFR